MKLLFNLTDEDISSDELKELLGYVDADLSFKNLLPDIITATNEVKKIIGNEVYGLLYDEYQDNLDQGAYTNDFTDLLSNLIRSTRYPIAIKAYSLFAPTNDLSHSNEGRRARSSENEKLPWQWMIDSDNKEQEKRYYRALDDLIALLDESKPDGYDQMGESEQETTVYFNWINSSAYKYTNSLFINSVDEFNKCYTIESRLLLIKITSGLEECERREIMPRIGKVKFDELKANRTPSDEKDIELLYYIKKACAFYSIAWAIPKMSITLFPEGVLQFQLSDRQNTIAKKPAIGNEHEYALQSFAKASANALIEIENLMAPTPEPTLEPKTILRKAEQCDKGFSAT